MALLFFGMSGTIVLNSLFVGLGLAVESFMVALANGLYNANKRILRGILYAFIFAACHAVALIIGYILVRRIADGLNVVEDVLTAIAVCVLLFVGIKMIVEGAVKKRDEHKSVANIAECVLQSAAASFDAFAVGLTMHGYDGMSLGFCCVVIATVIFSFYMIGFIIGKKFGDRFAKYAIYIGGAVFIALAAEVAITAWV